MEMPEWGVACQNKEYFLTVYFANNALQNIKRQDMSLFFFCTIQKHLFQEGKKKLRSQLILKRPLQFLCLLNADSGTIAGVNICSQLILSVRQTKNTYSASQFHILKQTHTTPSHAHPIPCTIWCHTCFLSCDTCLLLPNLRMWWHRCCICIVIVSWSWSEELL